MCPAHIASSDFLFKEGREVQDALMRYSCKWLRVTAVQHSTYQQRYLSNAKALTLKHRALEAHACSICYLKHLGLVCKSWLVSIGLSGFIHDPSPSSFRLFSLQHSLKSLIELFNETSKKSYAIVKWLCLSMKSNLHSWENMEKLAEKYLDFGQSRFGLQFR